MYMYVRGGHLLLGKSAIWTAWARERAARSRAHARAFPKSASVPWVYVRRKPHNHVDLGTKVYTMVTMVTLRTLSEEVGEAFLTQVTVCYFKFLYVYSVNTLTDL